MSELGPELAPLVEKNLEHASSNLNLSCHTAQKMLINSPTETCGRKDSSPPRNRLYRGENLATWFRLIRQL